MGARRCERRPRPSPPRPQPASPPWWRRSSRSARETTTTTRTEGEPVDVVKETKEKAREVASGGREKGSVGKKVLVSLAASAASGAAAYAARKAPRFLQEKVLPKLKELTSNGGTLERAKQGVESAVAAVAGGGQEER